MTVDISVFSTLKFKSICITTSLLHLFIFKTVFLTSRLTENVYDNKKVAYLFIVVIRIRIHIFDINSYSTISYK